MTPLTITSIIVAGLLIGLVIRNAARRSGGNPTEANRSQRRMVAFAMLVGAAILAVLACTDARERYVHAAIAIAMVGVAVWQLTQIRRERHRSQTETKS
jgi:phosphatidylglycerophosphate synthase